MGRYCLVCELEKDRKDDYIDLHLHCHETPWRTQLDALRKAGATDFLVYNHRDLAIMFFECDDMSACFARLDQDEDNRRWQARVAPCFSEDQSFDGSRASPSARKIFDLAQQLEGRFEHD